MKKFLSIIVAFIFAFFVSPSVEQNQIAQAVIQDAACVNVGGTCQTTTTSCSQPYLSGYCPSSGNTVKCCAPKYSISGTVCYDTNASGTCDADEGGPSNVTVSNTIGTTTTTNSSGKYSFQNLYSYPTTGYPYGISVPNPPANYKVSGSPAYLYLEHKDQTVNFPLTSTACANDPAPTGSKITTKIFTRTSAVANNDATNYGGNNAVDGILDLNKYWNSGNYPPQWIELDLGMFYKVTGLQLNVRQDPNGASNTQIFVGQKPTPTKLVKTINCNTNNNQILNVSLNEDNVRYIRLYTGSSTSWVAWNEITVYGSASSSQTSTPGIIYSGNISANFGQGSASITNWVVGGINYPEVFNTRTVTEPESESTKSLSSLTSYQYILDKITTAQLTPTDLTKVTNSSGVYTCSSLSNCTLPPSLPNGIYIANGNVNLNAYSFPANKDYVFLIKGDLTIRGNIIVPKGSTAFFTASHDIIIDKSVGTATFSSLPTGQIQGIYSADRDFKIEGVNNCLTSKDKMLNIEGAIVTNALGNGGILRNQRDLCGDNLNYPAMTVRARLDMLLNLPEVLMQRTTTFREDAP